MRRRGTARFVLALFISFVAYEVSFSKAMAAGYAVLGGWGLVAAIVVLGFGLAVLFTAVYNGPVALARLLKRQARSYRA
jgi:hypothetical protein